MSPGRKSRRRGLDLSEWQGYSGGDGNSASRDPRFVNPAGDRPEDFRRRRTPEDVAGSPYGPVCGAYATGEEVIGIR